MIKYGEQQKFTKCEAFYYTIPRTHPLYYQYLYTLIILNLKEMMITNLKETLTVNPRFINIILHSSLFSDYYCAVELYEQIHKKR